MIEDAPTYFNRKIKQICFQCEVKSEKASSKVDRHLRMDRAWIAWAWHNFISHVDLIKHDFALHIRMLILFSLSLLRERYIHEESEANAKLHGYIFFCPRLIHTTSVGPGSWSWSEFRSILFLIRSDQDQIIFKVRIENRSSIDLSWSQIFCGLFKIKINNIWDLIKINNTMVYTFLTIMYVTLIFISHCRINRYLALQTRKLFLTIPVLLVGWHIAAIIISL